MKVLRVDADHPDPASIAHAAEVILGGGIVAFPTETVYGLGGSALNEDAILRIFEAKGRPAYNPLIVHCRDVESARSLALSWPDAAERLAAALWPGPLTLVVRKTGLIPDAVTAGLRTVALRVPSHPVAQALLAAVRVPIAAPSANRFTEISPTAGAHVAKGLAGRLDLLLDSGPTQVGIESTVVDLSGPDPVLLRPGSIDPAHLEAIVGSKLLRPRAYQHPEPRPGPGMLDRHYSPRARLVMVPSGAGAELIAMSRSALSAGERVGTLLRELPDPAGVHRAVRMPDDPAEYARLIYSMLHDMDDEEIDIVLIEALPEISSWAGIRDRLSRAATSDV